MTKDGAMESRYAELHCMSNFSFLEGASHPEELVQTAAALGYEALAITDRATLSGIVRAHAAAKQVGMKLIIGAHLEPCDAAPLVVWAADASRSVWWAAAQAAPGVSAMAARACSPRAASVHTAVRTSMLSPPKKPAVPVTSR